MAYNALNNLIDAYIYANGVQAITGQILNGVLKQMVSQLGSGYHLMGVAGPETEPAANDYAMAYFAATAGGYTDFGGITLAAGEVAVLLTSGNGSWSKQTIYNVPTGTADLENTANFITNAVTDLVNYYTKTEVDDTLADYPTLAALSTALADYYTKTEIDGQMGDVDTALSDRYTKSETDTKLGDYYKKTETYDKDEVDSIVAALSRQEYIVAWDGLAAPDVSAIPAGVTVTYSGTTYTGTLAASASTVNKIYMVWNGVAYDMYGTSQDGGYSWVPMGTTTVDLSQYATKAELSQLQQEIGEIYKEGIVPDTFTFPGAGGYISFSPITLSEEGDALELNLLIDSASILPGMAFATNNGLRAITISNSIIGAMDTSGNWLTGMNAGQSEWNVYTNEGFYLYQNTIKFLVEGGNLKLYIDGTLYHTEPLATSITIDKIGGGYSTYSWIGEIRSFLYTHNGQTTPIYNLPGFAVSGDVTFTSHTEKTGMVVELEEEVENLGGEIENISTKSFAEAEATTVQDIDAIPGIVKMAGYNALVNGGVEVVLQSLSGFDSYYFYPDKAVSAWFPNSGDIYVAISVIENAQPISQNYISGTNAYRLRTTDGNLPTEQNPISIPQGSAIVFTVTADRTTSFAAEGTITTFNGDTPLSEKHIEQVLNEIDEGKGCYLSYSNGIMNIFTPVNNGLLKYVFEHDVVAAINADIWRIGYAALCDNTGAETKQITTSGEWEAAIHLPDRPDFSGGVLHGDEVYSSIKFFADGVPVDISSAISKLEFNELRILEASTMYDPNDSVTPIATHTSEHIFTKDGVTINQSLEWLISTSLTSSYMAMFPVAKAVTDSYCTDKDFTPRAIPSSVVSVTGVKSANIWSESEGVFCVFGVGNYRGLEDSQIRFLLTDNGGGNYNKCYYVITVGNDTTVNVGDVWKTTTFYKIMAE